jgi:hypothetical protein
MAVSPNLRSLRLLRYTTPSKIPRQPKRELGRGDEIAPLIFDMSVVDGSPQASV